MIETPPIEMELRKLGLKEKEVMVYLVGLKLGASAVKDIAKKAGIARPTAYEIIKGLEEKGLFAEVKKGKKRYFLAQSPVRILGVLRTQKKEIEEKEREFIRIIAALESKYGPKENKEIKTYKRKEGLRALEEIFSFASSPEVFVFCSSINPQEIKKRQNIYHGIKKRLGRIEVKEILPAQIKSDVSYIERKFFSSPKFKGALILFDKAIFIPPQKSEGLLIENSSVVNLLKSLFLILWDLI